MAELRAYQVAVTGFPPAIYSARTPAKARTRAWHDYQAAYECTFKEFMRLARVTRAAWEDGRHTHVLVSGKPATLVIHPYRRDLFMYDGSDNVMCAHHSEIEPMPIPAEN